jgi:N2-citryl-N6-acetyl-N6-hydroxylysine synthase
VNTRALAAQHSTTAFLNSWLKEWPKKRAAGLTVRAELAPGIELVLPLEKFSSLGRHRYAPPFFVEEHGARREISFLDLRSLVSEAFALHHNKLPAADFSYRVLSSENVIEEILREAAPQLKSLYANGASFLPAEQGLALGHSFHPTPKSREEFNQEDLHRYSPEFGGSFALTWFLARPRAILEECGEGLKPRAWLNDLYQEAFGEAPPEGWIPFPAHPWQKQRLLKDPRVKALLAEGLLVDQTAGSGAWHPTSSLRTIFRAEAPYMLKFSLSLRLTNSVRHITLAELRRGLQAHDVFASEEAKKFHAEHPAFTFLSEPAFVALRGSDGQPLVESIVVARSNPYFQMQNAAVLATLTQEAPFGGESLLLKEVRKAAADSFLSLPDASLRWFLTFVQVAVKPLLLAQAELGVILGAHQQNLMIGLERGWPTRAYFRDCHGTGYTARGVERFGSLVPRLSLNNGNLVPERMGHVLFGYYLILNSVFNVISALAADGWIEESTLLAEFRRELEALMQRPGIDASFFRYLLDSPELLHKGNFFCACTSLNENTSADPLALYVPIPNPFFRGNL